VDWAVALDIVQGNHALLKDVAIAFMSECTALLDQLAKSIAGNDSAAAGRAAHTLKGGLRTFGAVAATEMAEEIERATRAGELENAADCLAALAEKLDAVRRELMLYIDRDEVPETSGETAARGTGRRSAGASRA
jgi:HPt (histidine-containing phosphotransfer) domain-containing protein